MPDRHGQAAVLARRRLLQAGLGSAFALLGVPVIAATASLPAGSLLPPDANGLRLLPGFRSRIVARSGQPPLPNGRHRWHAAPDGGACFKAPDGGWIYVSNSELPGGRGGAGALRFDRRGNLVDAYPVLSGTTNNCAGGPTPWGTWLSGEEYDHGRIWECDPAGHEPAVSRPALGVFKHEAAAVDLQRGHVYLTEDVPDGCWYRYVAGGTPQAGRLDLEHGALEVALVRAGGVVDWQPLHDPLALGQPCREQVSGATRFRGGEGIWYANGLVHFSTKLDNRVWRYDVRTRQLDVLYDITRQPQPVLRGVDNITVGPGGDVLVAEDGDDMQVVALGPDGRLQVVLQVEGHGRSEVAGIAFDPSGTRLYFSSQRGTRGTPDDGYTFEVTEGVRP